MRQTALLATRSAAWRCYVVQSDELIPTLEALQKFARDLDAKVD